MNWKLATTLIWILIPVSLILGVVHYPNPPQSPNPTLPLSSGSSGKEIYKVIYIHDGDSFIIKHQGKSRRVRLMGTDAPELDQPYGSYAKNALAELILDKNIIFIYQTEDHYERLLGRISVVDKSGEKVEIPDVGLEMIKRGATWPNRTHKSFRAQYQKALEEAKTNRVGLWEQDNPIKPKEYRENKPN